MRRLRKTKYITLQMIRHYFQDGVGPASAELAYFLLFSFFPMIMLINSLLARINLSSQASQQILSLLPTSIQDMIHVYLNYLASEPNLSPMIISTVLTLFFLSRAVNSLLRTAKRIYGIKRRANTFPQILMALVLTVGFVCMILGSFILIIIGRTLVSIVEKYIPLPGFMRILTHQGGYFIMAAVVFVFLTLFNRVAPNAPQLKWRQVLPGSLLSLVSWLVLSLAFSFYVDNMARYSILYGSLGAVVVLMLWLYLSGMSIILGVQLNHILWKMRHIHAAWNQYHIEQTEDEKHENSSN